MIWAVCSCRACVDTVKQYCHPCVCVATCGSAPDCFVFGCITAAPQPHVSLGGNCTCLPAGCVGQDTSEQSLQTVNVLVNTLNPK